MVVRQGDGELVEAAIAPISVASREFLTIASLQAGCRAQLGELRQRLSRTSVGVVALVLFRARLRFPEVLVFDLDNLNHLGRLLRASPSFAVVFVVGAQLRSQPDCRHSRSCWSLRSSTIVGCRAKEAASTLHWRAEDMLGEVKRMSEARQKGLSG